MIRGIFLMIMGIASVLSVYSAEQDVVEPDSVATTELQEVVVRSKRSWISNGVFNYIPSSKEKRLSNSPASLVDVMAIPELKTDGRTITTMSGESVLVAINGEPANEIDIAAFWPKNVKKVEFMQDPSDPKYRGAKNVVNFIMAVYEVGGVTKIDADQSIPLKGWYTLASKLDYKRMSYGAKFEAKFDKFKNLKSESEDVYRGIFYDGVKYDEIIEKASGESNSESHELNLGFNADYRTNRITATHAFGIGWNRQPVNHFSSKDEWSVNLFGSDAYESSSSTKSTGFTVAGDYFFGLTRKSSLYAGWKYGFNDNSNDSWNQYGINPATSNQVNEKANALDVWARFGYWFNEKWSAAFSVNPSFNWFSSHYTGSVDARQRQFRDEITTKLHLYWQPVREFSLSLNPSLIATEYKVGDIKNSEVKPAIDFSARWFPNQKFYMMGNLNYRMYPVKAKESNNLIIKSSDLLWVEGNPNLKPTDLWMATLSASYFPNSILTIGGNVYYFRYSNDTYYSYRAAPQEMGGVIYTVKTGEPTDNLHLMANIRLFLFDGSLRLSLKPGFFHIKTRGEYARTLNFWRPVGDIAYIIGDFRIHAEYAGAQEDIGNAGESYGRRSSMFSAGVSYGWRDLYVNFTVYDILHDKPLNRRINYSNVLSGSGYSQTVGRRFALNLTYTFGYGKKTNQNINVNTNTSIESSVLDI